MTRAWLAALLVPLVLPLGAVELPQTLNLKRDGITLHYPDAWTVARRSSTVVGYYWGHPVTANEPASALLVAPEHDGFHPTLFVQSRTQYGQVNETMLDQLSTGLRSMGARIPGASFELHAARLASYGAHRGALFDYSFSVGETRLTTRHWVFTVFDTLVVAYTDTADRFAASVPFAEAMVESVVFSQPPPAVGYDTIINVSVTLALLMSLFALGLAWTVHRRRRRVEEYPEDFVP